MKKNMGRVDRVIRTLVAFTLVFLYERDLFDVMIGRTMLVIAALLIITSLFAYCPFYSLFGFNTCSRKQSNS
jgi:hypothetical protein